MDALKLILICLFVSCASTSIGLPTSGKSFYASNMKDAENVINLMKWHFVRADTVKENGTKVLKVFYKE